MSKILHTSSLACLAESLSGVELERAATNVYRKKGVHLEEQNSVPDYPGDY